MYQTVDHNCILLWIAIIVTMYEEISTILTYERYFNFERWEIFFSKLTFATEIVLTSKGSFGRSTIYHCRWYSCDLHCISSEDSFEKLEILLEKTATYPRNKIYEAMWVEAAKLTSTFLFADEEKINRRDIKMAVSIGGQVR